MLRLSKKADYALLAMRHLAAHTRGGAMSARELAEEYHITRKGRITVLPLGLDLGVFTQMARKAGGFRKNCNTVIRLQFFNKLSTRTKSFSAMDQRHGRANFCEG